MHDNPQAVQPMAVGPYGYCILTLSGRDSVAFAQAQFMNDVAALAPGHWQWNGWLTPKGRVVALFALLMMDAERLWLVLPDADPQALADGLRRFVFRSKVVIEIRGDVRAVGRFQAPGEARGDRFAIDAAGDVELDFGSPQIPRELRVTAAADADGSLAEQWRVADLEFGLPRLDESQAGQWTPQQLSLDRLNAYSVKKGCYPGQEIVARTHFLGKAKRGLALLEAGSALAVGADVTSDGSSIGSVVAAASESSNTRHVGLAVVGLDRNTSAEASAGVPVREVPILDGLAR